MNFFEAIESGYSKYFQFSGRAVRSEFWYFALFQLIVLFVLAPILIFMHLIRAGSAPDPSHVWIMSIPSLIFSLAIIIPNITMAVRRFHDMDRTGWWMSWSFLSVWLWIMDIVTIMSAQDLATPLADTPTINGAAEYMALFMTLNMLEWVIMIIFLCWMCVKGTEGENRFGPDPFMSHRHLKR